MTREQGVRDLVSSLLVLAREHPPSGKLEVLVARELEQSPFRLSRRYHTSSCEQVIALFRAMETPGISLAGVFHAIAAVAMILGSASTAGKGLATYGILYRRFRAAVTAFEKELHGRTSIAEAPPR